MVGTALGEELEFLCRIDKAHMEETRRRIKRAAESGPAASRKSSRGLEDSADRGGPSEWDAPHADWVCMCDRGRRPGVPARGGTGAGDGRDGGGWAGGGGWEGGGGEHGGEMVK